MSIYYKQNNTNHIESMEENVFQKYENLINRCDYLDSAVKLINDLNNLCYTLSDSISEILDLVENNDFMKIEKILNILVWLSTLKYPNLHEHDRDFSEPSDIISIIYNCTNENEQQFIDILERVCKKYNVDMNKYI